MRLEVPYNLLKNRTNVNQAWEDFNKLDKVTAVFFESLRLFRASIPASGAKVRIDSQGPIASAHVMIREAREDTILKIPGPNGEEGIRTIPGYERNAGEEPVGDFALNYNT